MALKPSAGIQAQHYSVVLPQRVCVNLSAAGRFFTRRTSPNQQSNSITVALPAKRNEINKAPQRIFVHP
jgi:hypothetical protein